MFGKHMISERLARAAGPHARMGARTRDDRALMWASDYRPAGILNSTCSAGILNSTFWRAF